VVQDSVLFRCGEIDCYDSKVFEKKSKDPTFKPIFAGKQFWDNCTHLPVNNVLLEEVLDLREADYSDDQISEALNFYGLPNRETIFNLIGKCFVCSERGHIASNCPKLTLNQNLEGPLAFLSDKSLSGPMRCCFRCLDLGHERNLVPTKSNAWAALVGVTQQKIVL
jgi:hypothetical protein